MQTALGRMRPTAKANRGTRFTTLMQRVYAIERPELAYFAPKRNGGPGVDGQTWTLYGQVLKANSCDLSDRLARGESHVKAAHRAHMTKINGSTRPLSVPMLEDKTVQIAAVEVFSAIYEQHFLGFCYGLRSGKSAHQALDEVVVAAGVKKVISTLNADIVKFFDSIKHHRMVTLSEHRKANARNVRLIREWLNPSVLEDGTRTRSEGATVQRSSISPRSANIEAVVVRYAD